MVKIFFFFFYFQLLFLKSWQEAEKCSDAPVIDTQLYKDFGALEHI